MFRLHLRPQQSQGGEGSEKTAWRPCTEGTGSERRPQGHCRTALGGPNTKSWRRHTVCRAIKGKLSHLYNTTFLQLDDSKPTHEAHFPVPQICGATNVNLLFVFSLHHISVVKNWLHKQPFCVISHVKHLRRYLTASYVRHASNCWITISNRLHRHVQVLSHHWITGLVPAVHHYYQQAQSITTCLHSEMLFFIC